MNPAEAPRAIILAAGEGKRLRPYTERVPKCLVLLGGRPILSWTLDALDELRFVEAVVVVGYRGDRVVEFLARRRGRLRVRAVWNRAFAWTNDSTSLGIGLASFPSPAGRGFVLVDGDLRFEPAVLGAVLRAPGDAVAAAARRPALGSEEVKVALDAGGSIARIGKDVDGDRAWGEALGLYAFSAAGARALAAPLGRLPAHQGYEVAFQKLIGGGFTFSVADVTGLRAIEIDTPEDLAAADRLFASQSREAVR
jgi:choline kinase